MVGHTGHLREKDLARGDEELWDPGQDAHLSWCRRCRNTVAEYCWQESELSTTLAAVAQCVPLPAGCWPRARAGLVAARRRERTARRLYTVFTCLCTSCLILLATHLGSVSAAAPELASAAPCVPAPSIPMASLYRSNLPEPMATPAPTDQPIELKPVPEPMGVPGGEETTAHLP